MPTQKKGPDVFQKILETAKIPAGYSVDLSGIYRLNERNEDEKVSDSPLVAKAYTRDENGDNWKILLTWLDLDDNIREEAYDRSLILESKTMIKELVQKGFPIYSEQRRNFVTYLENLSPPKRMRHVAKLGWYNNSEGLPSFVLPEKVIGHQQKEEIYFQQTSSTLTVGSMKQKGFFDKWQSEIAEKTKGNPIMIFCLSAAFAGPLIKLLGAETGGFHIYGQSTHGKTTAMQVAASVWGNGEAPTRATDITFIRTWAATSNALEGIAAAHNDSLMILDEIGQCDATDFKKIVYDLATGIGKARAQTDGSLTTQTTWRNIYLSTGEFSAKQRLEADKEMAKAGQLLRLIDIPTDDGIILETGGMPPAAFADKLQESCGKNYGWAGPAFVDSLLKEIGDGDQETNLQTLAESYEFYQKQLHQKGLEAPQERAIKRIALINLAGELACQLNILPLDELEDIRPAIAHVKNIWLRANIALDDTMRTIKTIRDYIAVNKDKFLAWGDKWEDKKDPAGYKKAHEGKHLYLFHISVFQREFCQTITVKSLCQKLKEKNCLFQNEPNKLVTRYLREGEKLSFYAITSNILSFDFGDE